MNYSKLLSVTAFAAFTLFSTQSNAFTVGLAMPTQEEPKWYKEGFLLQDKLQDKGFTVDLFYAGDYDVELQKRQITRLTDAPVDVLVVGALDGGALTEVLKTAKSKNIPVISYDRLLTGTDAVSYYATFDNEAVGKMQGQYIIDKLNLDSTYETKNIEIFAGSLDDNNAKLFYKGAYETLKPYIDAGQLVVKSGETSIEKTTIKAWMTDFANKRMGDLISKVGYAPNGGVKLDAILSPADCLSEGIAFALNKAGYTKSTMPIITGQDAVPAAIERIREGEQSMSVYKDSRVLCDTVVKMIKSIQNRQEVEVNDTSSYNNGAMNVPSFLCEPMLIDVNNLNSLPN